MKKKRLVILSNAKSASVAEEPTNNIKDIMYERNVKFWDSRKCFWRIGICYDEDKNFYLFRDQLGHRYKVSKKESNTVAPVEAEANKNGNLG